MPLPFDATLKHMTAKYTRDFEAALRLPGGPVPGTVLNVDLSTVSAASDIVLGYGEPLQRLIDLNFQSGRDPDLARRLLLYNALLHHRYGVPVCSVVVLLRQAADDTALTGRLEYTGGRRGRLRFGYEVVRLWQRPVRSLLRSGLGTLPLAPLCRLPEGVPLEEALAAVIRRIDERLRAEAPSEDAAELLSATFILTGLRVPRETAIRLFQGVRAMRESTTYQAILEEGREEGLRTGREEGLLAGIRETLLRQGRQKFGAPDAATAAALGGITDRARLERMADRVLTAADWQDLLATP